MNLKLQITFLSIILQIFGYSLLWYLTDWKVVLTILVLFWGANLQNLIVMGKFDGK